MAGKWGVPIQVLLLLLSTWLADASENHPELEFGLKQEPSADVGIVSESKPDLGIFQDGQEPSFQSKWDAVKHDIQNVLVDLPERGPVQDEEDDSALSSDEPVTRGQALRSLYNRLVLAAKTKRGLYGSVLRGYKLGKREFMPYELMNEYQKRLFGSVLNNYKFGKRVPEELPANYLTGGQIYDNITDDPRERKRVFGSFLRGYKMGKRIPRLDYYKRALRNPWLQLPNNQIVSENI